MTNTAPAPTTSIVKWSRWTRRTDESGIAWLRYSIRCTDPLPQELFDKVNLADIDPKSCFFTMVDGFDETEEGVQTFSYKSYGFIIREDALFGSRTLEGQIYPHLVL